MGQIKERKVQWHAKTRQLSQVPSEGLEYAFLTKDYVQIHQLVWCKDFMQDALYGHLNDKIASIYGFKYDPKKDPPLYLGKTRILIANYKDHDFGKKVLENLQPFLHAIEVQLKMAKTQFERCASPPSRYKKAGVYIANGSKRWMQSPPMISLYTLLLRVGLVHNPEDDPLETIRKVRMGTTKGYYNHSDSGIIDSGEKGLNRILKHGDRKLFHRDMSKNYEVDTTGIIHNDCGLASFSYGGTAKKFPHWHREEVK